MEISKKDIAIFLAIIFVYLVGVGIFNLWQLYEQWIWYIFFGLWFFSLINSIKKLKIPWWVIVLIAILLFLYTISFFHYFGRQER